MGFTAKTWTTGGNKVLVITIPKNVREAYQIKKEDYLEVTITKVPKPKKLNE